MSETSVFDNRPRATYSGDRRGSVGVMVGPTTTDEFLEVCEEVYNEQTNTTTLYFRYATTIPGSHAYANQRETGRRLPKGGELTQ